MRGFCSGNVSSDVVVVQHPVGHDGGVRSTYFQRTAQRRCVRQGG